LFCFDMYCVCTLKFHPRRAISSFSIDHTNFSFHGLPPIRAPRSRAFLCLPSVGRTRLFLLNGIFNHDLWGVLLWTANHGGFVISHSPPLTGLPDGLLPPPPPLFFSDPALRPSLRSRAHVFAFQARVLDSILSSSAARLRDVVPSRSLLLPAVWLLILRSPAPAFYSYPHVGGFSVTLPISIDNTNHASRPGRYESHPFVWCPANLVSP